MVGGGQDGGGQGVALWVGVVGQHPLAGRDGQNGVLVHAVAVGQGRRRVVDGQHVDEERAGDELGGFLWVGRRDGEGGRAVGIGGVVEHELVAAVDRRGREQARGAGGGERVKQPAGTTLGVVEERMQADDGVGGVFGVGDGEKAGGGGAL